MYAETKYVIIVLNNLIFHWLNFEKKIIKQINWLLAWIILSNSTVNYNRGIVFKIPIATAVRAKTVQYNSPSWQRCPVLKYTETFCPLCFVYILYILIINVMYQLYNRSAFRIPIFPNRANVASLHCNKNWEHITWKNLRPSVCTQNYKVYTLQYFRVFTCLNCKNYMHTYIRTNT